MQNSENKPRRGIGEIMTGFYQKHPLLSHIMLIAVTAVFLSLAALLFLDVWTDHGKTATVPDIKGVPYTTAATLLDECGLGIEVSDSVYDSSSAPGIVTKSWPRAHTTVKPGRTVYVTINALSPRQITINVPLVDISSRQAVAYLEGLGLKNIRTEYVPGQFDDLVKGAYYNGRQLGNGSVIPITASVTVIVTRAYEDNSADSTEVAPTAETATETDEPTTGI